MDQAQRELLCVLLHRLREQGLINQAACAGAEELIHAGMAVPELFRRPADETGSAAAEEGESAFRDAAPEARPASAENAGAFRIFTAGAAPGRRENLSGMSRHAAAAASSAATEANSDESSENTQ